MNKLIRFSAIGFPVFMVCNGAVDVLRPEALRQAMDTLFLPHYMLYIVGVAKILGGLALLMPVPPLFREWAYAGFFIWWIGGIAVHAFSGHPPAQYVGLAILGPLLVLSFLAHHRGRQIRSAD